MKEINRTNYEFFVMDFIEGNLSPADTAAFLAFLSENPSIEAEIENLRERDIRIPRSTEKIHFDFLKKDLNTQAVNNINFEEMCIAFHENDLNESAKSKLFDFIKDNAGRKRIFELYGQLKAKPDITIRYKEKSSLIKEKASVGNIRRYLYISATLAAAASIAAILFFRLMPSASQLTDLSQESTVVSLQTTPSDIKHNETPIDEQNNISVSSNPKDEPVLPLSLVNQNNTAQTLLAVIDTAQPEDDEYIHLSMIEPSINSNITLKPVLPRRNITIEKRPDNNAKEDQSIRENLVERGNSLFASATNIKATDVINFSILGFNKMVEGDLAYKAETNEKGKIKTFALSSGNRVVFERQINRNN